MAGAYTWHTLGRACVGLGLASPPPFFTLGPSHAHPFPRTPFFPHQARQTPTFLQPPSLTGHGQVAGISRVWGVVPYSPVFPPSSPCHHPFLLGPSHAHPVFTTPFLQPGPAIAQTLSHCRMYGCMSPPRYPSPIFTDYMRLCMGDTSPPWTHT
jgi:hypothetical protein